MSMDNYTIKDVFSKGIKHFSPGLYMVGMGEDLFYIGISRSDVAERLYTHFGLSTDWTEFKPTMLRPFVEANLPKSLEFWVRIYSLSELDAPDLDTAEMALIKKLSPMLNKTGNDRPAAVSSEYVWPKSIFGFDLFRNSKEAKQKENRMGGGLRLLARYTGKSADSFANLSGFTEINGDTMIALKDWALLDGYTVGTVNTSLVNIRHYARRAYEAGVIDAARYAGIVAITGISNSHAEYINQRRPVTRKLSRKDGRTKIDKRLYQKILAACDDSPRGKRDKAIIQLIAEHKMRIETICGLTPHHAKALGVVHVVSDLMEGKGDNDLILTKVVNKGRKSYRDELSGEPMIRQTVMNLLAAIGNAVGVERLGALDLLNASV